MYHVKYHHVPSIEEVGCESFTRNVLDPLIDIVENLELFIMVIHTANIIDPSRLVYLFYNEYLREECINTSIYTYVHFCIHTYDVS